MRKIKMNLSHESLQNAINELDNYCSDLERKSDAFVERLCEIGLPVIKSNLANIVGDAEHFTNPYVKMVKLSGYSRATLVVEGKELLFIEFGAGIHYNGSAGSSPHPLANNGKFPAYKIGSYGKGNGKKDSWYYYADTGETEFTHGTKAAMPVYKAALEMERRMIQVAKEVFGGA